jgi:phage terminase small subunit
MGRPRKPTELILLQGGFKKNPQRAKGRTSEPIPKGLIGKAPDRLNADEAALWDEICEECPPGVLKSSDRKMLENYCRLQAEVNKGRATAADFSQVKAYLQQFGLSPASRSLVSVPQEDNGNEFAAI